MNRVKKYHDLCVEMGALLRSGVISQTISEYVKFYFTQGIGPSCFLIYNQASDYFDFISEETGEVLKLNSSLKPDEGIHSVKDLVTNDDYVLLQSWWKDVEDFFNCSLSISKASSLILLDVNINQGTRIFCQLYAMPPENPSDALFFMSITDVSHIKKHNEKMTPALSIYDLENECHFHYLPERNLFIAKGHTLSPRETEIIKLYQMRKSTRDIADLLSLSPFTVQTHRANMMKKLKCKNKAELLHLVHEHQLA